METDINIPKTKSVNFMFQSLKFNVYVYIFVYTTQNLINLQDYSCSETGTEMQNLMRNGSICLMAFNAIGLFYIWCKDTFARIEFWLIYILNIVWFMIILMDVLKTINNQPKECMQIIMLQKTYFVLSIKN